MKNNKNDIKTFNSINPLNPSVKFAPFVEAKRHEETRNIENI